MPYLIDGKPFCCRHCELELEHSVVDLGLSPLCEDFLREGELNEAERFYPLHVFVCERCWLVQAAGFCSHEEIFDDDYGYFSSWSTSWLAHARRYVGEIVERLALSERSFVVEIASNDGYLLRNFVERGIPCLGVEPAAGVAAAATELGVDTHVAFFTEALARSMAGSGRRADLVIGNNVLAHTPNVNDFVAGVSALLDERGTATFEFPHLLKLMEEVQFDTIYHEHYSYYSLYTVCRMFESVGLHVVDVQRLETAGGSLRVFVEHVAAGGRASAAVGAILDEETTAGLRELSTYAGFGERVARVKDELLKLLIRLKEEGRSVAGYGAPGKGNTLLNYCGIKPDLLPYTCDRSTHKHGRYCPGSRVPIHPPEYLDERRPDYILILPWNLEREIVAQLAHARAWGAKFIVPVPSARIVD